MSVVLWSRVALCDPHGSWAYLLTGDSASGQVFTLLQRRGAVIRRIRGHHCETKQALLAEWARAFNFPEYFGHNWDAFNDCLTDLDWLPAECYIAIVSDSGDVLPDDDASFATFIKALWSAATTWATPETGDWARPAIAFRVLFHATAKHEERVRARLQRVGVDLRVLSARDMLDSS